MDEQTRQRRVLNLLSRVDRKTETLKQWAVRKLLLWQPGAQRIRFEGRCGISKCRSKYYLSYQLPGITGRVKGDHEDCGYYCPSCGFANAGSRPIKHVGAAALMQSAHDYLAQLKNRKASGGIQFTHQDFIDRNRGD